MQEGKVPEDERETVSGSRIKGIREGERKIAKDGRRQTLLEDKRETVLDGGRLTVLEGKREKVLNSGRETLRQGEERETVLEEGKQTVLEDGREIIRERGRQTVLVRGSQPVQEGEIETVPEGGRETKPEGGRETVPEGGRGWTAVIAVFLFNIIFDGCIASFSILYKEILDEFHATKSNAAWIGSLISSAPFLLAPVAGKITRILGSRMTTSLGGLITCIGFVIGSFSTSTVMLVIFYGFVGGFGLSLPYFNSFKSLSDNFDRRLALVSCIAQCGSGLGLLSFAPLTEYLVSVFGWKGALLIMSGIVLNVIVCGVLLPKPVKEHESFSSSNENHLLSPLFSHCFTSQCVHKARTCFTDNVHNDEINSTSVAKIQKLYLFQFKNVYFVIIMFVILNFVMFFWIDIPYVFLVASVISNGVSARNASYLLTVTGISQMIGTIGYCILCNRKNLNFKMIYGISTGLCGVSMVLMPIFHEYTPLLVLAGCFGLLSVAIEAFMLCILIELVGKEPFDNFFCGFVIFTQGAANLCGPPFAGYLIDYTGSYDTTFYTAGASVAAAGCLYVTLSRTSKKPTSLEITLQ